MYLFLNRRQLASIYRLIFVYFVFEFDIYFNLNIMFQYYSKNKIKIQV